MTAQNGGFCCFRRFDKNPSEGFGCFVDGSHEGLASGMGYGTGKLTTVAPHAPIHSDKDAGLRLGFHDFRPFPLLPVLI